MSNFISNCFVTFSPENTKEQKKLGAFLNYSCHIVRTVKQTAGVRSNVSHMPFFFINKAESLHIKILH